MTTLFIYSLHWNWNALHLHKVVVWQEKCKMKTLHNLPKIQSKYKLAITIIMIIELTPPLPIQYHPQTDQVVWKENPKPQTKHKPPPHLSARCHLLASTRRPQPPHGVAGAGPALSLWSRASGSLRQLLQGPAPAATPTQMWWCSPLPKE